MGEEFYCTVKLITGEEIFALACVEVEAKLRALFLNGVQKQSQRFDTL